MDFALWTAAFVADVIFLSLTGVFWIGLVVLAIAVLGLFARRSAA